MLTLALVPINAIVTSVSKLFSLFTGAKEEMSLTEGIMATMAVTAGVIYGLSKKTAIQASITKGLETGRMVIAGIKMGYDVASGKLKAKEILTMNKGLGKQIALSAAKIFGVFENHDLYSIIRSQVKSILIFSLI